MNLVLWYCNCIKSEPRILILKLLAKSEPWDMIVPRKTKWIMDNESIKRWDECTCWKDNNMIAHKWTSRREIKTIFLSEPSQVNKPIPRVNLSDNDSIMMFEWAKNMQYKNSDYKRTGLWGLLQATQVNLTDKLNQWRGVNLVHRIIIHGKWTWKNEIHHWKRSVPECVEQSHFRSEP